MGFEYFLLKFSKELIICISLFISSLFIFISPIIILYILFLLNFLIISFNGYFNNVPLLKLNLVDPSLCIPITLLFSKFNIGEPDEPLSVEHICIISYLFILFNIPYDTHIFFPKK